MFAVPGWSVSSSLLKAEKPEGAKIESKPVDPEAVIEGESKKSSKKRKRNAEIAKKGPKDVNVGNMEELWETVIEGKPKEKKLKKGDKPQKVAEEGSANGEEKDTSGSKSKHMKKSKATVLEEEAEFKEPDSEGADVPKERVKKGKTMKEKKREKKAKLKAIADGTAPDTAIDTTSEPLPITTTKPISQPLKPTLTPLQASMRQKLISARFRHLNQTLYTTPSAHSLSLFAENPEMFTEYHEGFRRQVEVWPENPVDIYLAQILSRGPIKGPSRGNPLDKTKEQALPRTEGTCVLADLGCGDAALSTSLQPHLKKLKLKIHSFDLQSPSPLVTKADIANLPLKDGSVDVAIFCLALMGTNWVDFIEEAYRILRWKGELWIAEIKSRFGRVASAGAGGKKVVDHSVGNRKRPLDKKAKKAADEAADDEVAAVEVDGQDDRGGETDVSAFVEVLRKRGFVLRGEGQGGEKSSVDLSNRMFVRMCFVKGTSPIKGKCVPAPKGAEEFMTATAKAAAAKETWKRKAPKGKGAELEGEEDEHVSSEAKVLKPCVYKLR
ncbi:hypothetical protein VTL71DRAFT_7211 [Oculimacula yallundae]|uniref:Ribosomal RNA-processing protein 8 n=1 Tax=Oculimacula yallundae TaxID=86028 RepID=A0ABR4BW42_9HELO